MFRLIWTLPIILTACLKDETVSGYADRSLIYSLQEMNGVTFPASATIAFPEEGETRGTGPCNSWSARQTAPYPWFAVGPIRATRRACQDLQHETDFFAALDRMTLIEVSGPVLILRNDQGDEMVFQAP